MQAHFVLSPHQNRPELENLLGQYFAVLRLHFEADVASQLIAFLGKDLFHMQSGEDEHFDYKHHFAVININRVGLFVTGDNLNVC